MKEKLLVDTGFNMYKRYSIVLVRDIFDNVLLGKRNDNGLWTQPGGGANKNECAYSCAYREFLEETGVSLKELKIIKIISNENKDLIYLFEGKLPENFELDSSKDPDLEVREWVFIDPNDVVEELHIPIERNAALKYWIEN